jgi:pimeloyl-ACP methyl ester carboxylesterase
MVTHRETIEFAGAGGVRLAADRWVPATGTHGAVVLLHGGGQTRHSWTRTAERLAGDGWLTVTLDARGHGDSEWSDDYSLDVFVDDLCAVVDTFDARPVLIGASLGGRTALVAEGERRGVAAGLVLVDITPTINQAGQRRVQEFLGSAPEGFASLEAAAEAIDAYQSLPRRRRNVQGLRKNLRQRDDGRWYWHWDPRFLEFGTDPRNSAVDRLTRATGNVTAPTLLVRGRHSELVTAQSAAEFIDLVPSAELVEVDAGHMVTGHDNDVFTVRLNQFLRDRVLRDPARHAE